MNWKRVVELARTGNLSPNNRIEKTAEEWATILNPEQYRVTRMHGTERPFSGAYCESHTPGLYACVCCGTTLFDSREKFDSGTGWPSFTLPVQENAISYIEDNSYGMHRIEVQCATCDAHLGHVFPDGPPPSGLRYCINAVSMVMCPTGV